MHSSKYNLLLIITVATYFTASIYVFDKVYNTIQIVIDEFYHIPQGLAFCNRNFTYWHPKITTLPGLYFITSTVIGSYFDCNIYNLRFINLVASAINLFLFASILKYVYGGNDFKIILQALNLTLLPPLYFFSHMYYTDTLSVTFLLAFSRLSLVNKYKLPILICGFLSVIMRQTNIVWIAMVLGHKIIDLLIKTSRVFGNPYLNSNPVNPMSVLAKEVDDSKLRRYYGLKDLLLAVKYHIYGRFQSMLRIVTLNDYITMGIHLSIISCFCIFVIINGSIVVGDKTAHQATLHIPQLFYFLIFYGVFGLPYVLAKFNDTLKLMLLKTRRVMLITIVFLIIVHFDTHVHPYLLADNRHYTFYVWNRWFGRYPFAIYATVPAYVFLLYNLYVNLKDQNCISFLMPFCICLFCVLGLQKMIEVRYFLIPYIILRLRFFRPTNLIVLAEFFWYMIINVATFYVFFKKEVMWSDFEHVQRIIW